MAKRTPADNRKLFDREVEVDLTEQQALVLHDKAQHVDAQADELEAKLNTEVKERKARIATLRSEAERDRSAAAKRVQLVTVKVYEELRGSQVFVIRNDNGEIVDQRAASLEEQQQTFPGLDGGGDLPDDVDGEAADYSPDPDAPTSAEEKTTRRGRGRKAKP